VTPRVVASGLGIRFLFDHERRVVTPTLAKLRRRGAETWGLHGVDLDLRGGEGVALLGPSGSGKTTLLRVLGGIYVPDAGTLSITGRVASLLSVDAGLLSLLTGRENAQLLCVLAGETRRSAQAALADVHERSRLGASFDRPVSSYSQGMRARLGFAVAERSDPSILLLDEVHEALDHEFREIVRLRAEAILASGGIVVAAGHDHPLLEQICTRAILLDGGVVRAEGAFADVQRAYLEPA
jgi:ABC-type polysaccharide/polyol phosphate transport system ATPase subunit